MFGVEEVTEPVPVNVFAQRNRGRLDDRRPQCYVEGVNRGSIILLLTLASFVCAGCASRLVGPAQQASTRSETGQPLDIRALRAELVGKSFPQVLHAVGYPDRQFGTDRWDWWVYDNRFYDSVTRRTLPEVTLVFHEKLLADMIF
ncbi:MAG TPA: hypothetical protein VL486_03230 [Verrucomicrobiae bacterium]|nr:hypothetical protein [Verrucomicrobiae bacterium]